jgi:drug/metabolite transporter (DMT)-like permease
MMKKFLITGIACTIVGFVLSFVVHGVLLEPEYNALVARGLFRAPEEAHEYFPFMILANVLFGFAFAWIYLQGITPGRPWYLQGLAYAAAIVCLMTIPMYLIYYVVQPMPGVTVARQIALETVVVGIIGLVAAFVNRE